MTQKRSKPAPSIMTDTGLGIAMLASSCTSENTKPLAEFQAAFIADRYGFAPARARLVAQLAWGRE